MLPVHEACATIMAQARPMPGTPVALGETRQRFVSQDLLARHDLPGFDNSAMDGYAVRNSDVSDEPGRLRPVRGESRAGGPPPPPLEPGCAMRIFTGAPMPDDADTVIIQENATTEGDQVRFSKAPSGIGQHVRMRGRDLRAGDLALPAGRELSAGELALLAGQGYAQVPVHGRPRVAILSTGDELCDVELAGTPGRVVNSNAYALAAQVQEAGCEPWVLPTARDRADELADRLQQALTADVVISAGGVSVGTYDLVADAFTSAGVRTVFWKVAVKPGKPLLFGMHDVTPVFGLPGNPGGAMVTFEVFVRPLLRTMLGDRAPYRASVDVRLTRELRHGHGRTELMRATLREVDGVLEGAPGHDQGSGSLPSMASVDALLVLPPGRDVFAAGSVVRAILTSTQSSATPSFAGANEA